MTEHKRGFLAVLGVMVLAGCASVPSMEQQAAADYGRVMSADECVSVTEQTISRLLKDPGSAQYRHSPCIRGYWSSVPILGMRAAFGYFQQGEINAKNSFGGYVGFRQYQILMKNGLPIRYCIADDNGLCVAVGN